MKLIFHEKRRKGRAMTSKNPAPIRALGETAIRCADLPRMKSFYEDIVGLPVMRDFSESGMCFFRIVPGHGDHTCILALFAADAAARDVHPRANERPRGGPTSTLHHLALTVDLERQDDLCAFLEARGIPYNVEHFAWTGWRGVFISDPEGNTVEFVAGGYSVPE